MLQEARSQARLDHPGICKVFEVGEFQPKGISRMVRCYEVLGVTPGADTTLSTRHAPEL